MSTWKKRGYCEMANWEKGFKRIAWAISAIGLIIFVVGIVSALFTL